MEVLSNIDLLQYLVRPRANTKAAIVPKATAATTKSWPTSEPEAWTEEDDKTLRELKTANTSWKQILAALGDKHTSESQMKARWKEIEGKAVSGTAGGGDSNENLRREEEKRTKAEKAKAEGLAKQAAAKEGKGEKKKGILKVAYHLDVW